MCSLLEVVLLHALTCCFCSYSKGIDNSSKIAILGANGQGEWSNLSQVRRCACRITSSLICLFTEFHGPALTSNNRKNYIAEFDHGSSTTSLWECHYQQRLENWPFYAASLRTIWPFTFRRWKYVEHFRQRGRSRDAKLSWQIPDSRCWCSQTHAAFERRTKIESFFRSISVPTPTSFDYRRGLEPPLHGCCWCAGPGSARFSGWCDGC